MLASQEAWLTRLRRKAGLTDEFGLRAGAHVRAVDRRIWSLRVARMVVKWAAFPGWGAVTLLMLRRTLQTGSLWSLPGLGIAASSLVPGAILLLLGRRLRREIEVLEIERFELSEDAPDR